MSESLSGHLGRHRGCSRIFRLIPRLSISITMMGMALISSTIEPRRRYQAAPRPGSAGPPRKLVMLSEVESISAEDFPHADGRVGVAPVSF